jgi:excisionase family DNA binding protein
MKPNEDDAPLLLSREQVAKLLGVSASHVKRLEARGVLTPIRLGATVKHVKADVEAAIRRLADEAKRKSGE